MIAGLEAFALRTTRGFSHLFFWQTDAGLIFLFARTCC